MDFQDDRQLFGRRFFKIAQINDHKIVLGRAKNTHVSSYHVRKQSSIVSASSVVYTEEWRNVQEEMLRSYLATAQSDLRAKQVKILTYYSL
jgi:hypothetical protein